MKRKVLDLLDNVAFALLILAIIIIAMWFVRQIPVDVEAIRSGTCTTQTNCQGK